MLTHILIGAAGTRHRRPRLPSRLLDAPRKTLRDTFWRTGMSGELSSASLQGSLELRDALKCVVTLPKKYR